MSLLLRVCVCGAPTERPCTTRRDHPRAPACHFAPAAAAHPRVRTARGCSWPLWWCCQGHPDNRSKQLVMDAATPRPGRPRPPQPRHTITAAQQQQTEQPGELSSAQRAQRTAVKTVRRQIIAKTELNDAPESRRAGEPAGLWSLQGWLFPICAIGSNNETQKEKSKARQKRRQIANWRAEINQPRRVLPRGHALPCALRRHARDECNKVWRNV